MARRTLTMALMAASALANGGCPRDKSSGPPVRKPPRPQVTASAKAPIPAASATPQPSSSACEPAPESSAAAIASGDLCPLTRGPIQLSFTGQPAIWLGKGETEPHVVFNRDGVPRAITLPASRPPKDPNKAGKPERLALAEPAERATAPGCAMAGAWLFCADKEGAIHRSGLAGEGSTVVARARPGGPIAAAPIAGSHVVYAFLGDRKTTEGVTTLAFAGLDDAVPQVLSEDGSGATFVTLGARGEEVVALYVDARRALTPVHARVLSGGAKLGLGPDAVIFVGEGTEGRTAATLAQAGPGKELALLPIFKDVKSFGMAAIRVDEQPRDDSAVTWSLYPAGLERAPIAASRGLSPVRVLRVRPASAEPKAKQVLELGELEASGSFVARCAVAESSTVADLSVIPDGAGGLWLAYTDAEGTWIERRGGAR